MTNIVNRLPTNHQPSLKQAISLSPHVTIDCPLPYHALHVLDLEFSGNDILRGDLQSDGDMDCWRSPPRNGY